MLHYYLSTSRAITETLVQLTCLGFEMTSLMSLNCTAYSLLFIALNRLVAMGNATTKCFTKKNNGIFIQGAFCKRTLCMGCSLLPPICATAGHMPPSTLELMPGSKLLLMEATLPHNRSEPFSHSTSVVQIFVPAPFMLNA